MPRDKRSKKILWLTRISETYTSMVERSIPSRLECMIWYFDSNYILVNGDTDGGICAFVSTDQQQRVQHISRGVFRQHMNDFLQQVGYGAVTPRCSDWQQFARQRLGVVPAQHERNALLERSAQNTVHGIDPLDSLSAVATGDLSFSGKHARRGSHASKHLRLIVKTQ